MKKRIFIGMTEVAGAAYQLCLGFRALGYVCDFVVVYLDIFNYPQPEQSLLLRLVHSARTREKKAGKAKKTVSRVFWKHMAKIFMAALFFQCLFRYDVFFFYSDKTFHRHNLDLPILKFFKKTVFFLYCGSDSRPPYLNGKNTDLADTPAGTQKLAEMTRRQKEKLLWAEKYADHICNTPPQSPFHERQYINLLIFGNAKATPPPTSLARKCPCGSKTVILHAPTHLAAKGTREIREIIATLTAKGYSIEYVEIIGEPHETVLKRLSECDFVIDQMYSDAPMANLAAEAAFFGKPTVVGGYYADFVENDLPKDLLPPSFYVHPDKVEAAVEKLINDVEFRLALGARAKHFVESNCQPLQVAGKIAQVIEGTAPLQWLCDPYELRYLLGCGLTERSVGKMVAALVDAYGPEALQLEDKPRQREALLRLMRETQAQ